MKKLLISMAIMLLGFAALSGCSIEGEQNISKSDSSESQYTTEITNNTSENTDVLDENSEIVLNIDFEKLYDCCKKAHLPSSVFEKILSGIFIPQNFNF